jgi:hypothetical protein
MQSYTSATEEDLLSKLIIIRDLADVIADSIERRQLN